MKLLVDRLEVTPTTESFEASPSWWQEHVVESRELDYAIDGPFRFDTEAYKLAEDIFLGGSFSGAIQVECSRCLQRYRHALSERFRLVLLCMIADLGVVTDGRTEMKRTRAI